jgi:hypothetical protein
VPPVRVGCADLAQVAPNADLVASLAPVVCARRRAGLRTARLLGVHHDLALVLVKALEDVFEEVVDDVGRGDDLHVDTFKERGFKYTQEVNGEEGLAMWLAAKDTVDMDDLTGAFQE